MSDDPVIIALDFQSPAEADQLVASLGESVGFYKVGMELYAAAGMDYVNCLLDRRKRVFLDLKFHDIGETVKRAVAVVAKTGVSFLTVHGVPQVVRAAVQGRATSDLRLLAVTVLTSLDQKDIEEDGYEMPISELVARRARCAMDAGADGLVGSPLEAVTIRKLAGPDAILVTPGVRSPGNDTGDQKRFATPAEAVRDGVNYVVIGRQVTRAARPGSALEQIRRELA